MNTHVTSLSCKLFLEGIEVPFNTVTVNERVNNPPSCTITFPPQSGALKVLPGTIVQVFGERKIVGEELENFIIFEGEVSGITYMKTADSRQAALQVKSFTYQWKKIQKFAVDYLPQYTSQFAGFYHLQTSEMDAPDTEEETEIENTEKMEHSNILGIHQYLHDSIKKYNTDELIEGNTNVIFSELLKTFKKQSFYYAMLDQSLKISDTFFGFPSQAGFVSTKIATTNAQVIKQMIRGTNVLNFYDLLMLYAEFYNMTLVFPASYTRTNHVDTGEQVPMRGYFVPDLSYAMPIKSNIVFPSELHSVSTSRNFDAEPTVLISNLDRVTLSEGSNSGIAPSNLMPVYMSPGLPVGEDSNEKPLLGFTPEERYRGRTRAENISIPTFSELYMVARAKKELSIDGKEKLTDDEKKSLRETVDLMLKRFTDTEFLKRRYKTRTCTAETDYNPYRIVGFPGLVFDFDGSPSMIGLLEGQTISINSEGRAISSLTYSSTRMIWDDTDFTELVEGTSTSFPLYNLTNDVFPNIPLWYDENFYSYNNIGVEMYPYVQKGTLGRVPPNVKGTLTDGDSQWYSWKGGPTILKQAGLDGGKDYNKNIAAADSDKTDFYDCSLASFARDSESGKVMSIGVNDSAKTNSIKALTASINAIKNMKNGFKASKNKPHFIKIHNHREIINQEDYFKFLGVGAKINLDGKTTYIPQYPTDYKDIDALATSAKPFISLCEDASKGNGPAEFNKPFSKKRADHVIKAFEAYLEDTTVKKNKVIVTR
jgi:hypothetical protein